MKDVPCQNLVDNALQHVSVSSKNENVFIRFDFVCVCMCVCISNVGNCPNCIKNLYFQCLS